MSVKSFLHSLSEESLVKARELSLWDVGDISEDEDRFIKDLKETAKRLKKESVKRKMATLTVKLREAERTGNEKELVKLTKEFEIFKKMF